MGRGEATDWSNEAMWDRMRPLTGSNEAVWDRVRPLTGSNEAMWDRVRPLTVGPMRRCGTG